MNALIAQVAIGETRNVMSKAIKRFAEELNARVVENQLSISMDSDGNLVFHRCFLYKEVQKMTFNEMLGVKVDLKGREGLATPFIQDAIKRLANEKEIENVNDIKIYCFSLDEKAKNILMYAYNNNEKLQQITWKYLFN